MAVYEGIIKVKFEMDRMHKPAYMDPGEEYLDRLIEGVWKKDSRNNNCVIDISSELKKSADAATPDGQTHE